MTRHQYGISALVSQASFGGKPVVASPNVGFFLRLASKFAKRLHGHAVKFMTLRLVHGLFHEVRAKSLRVLPATINILIYSENK